MNLINNGGSSGIAGSIEGETCMHGNSWHSECSECNTNSLLDDIFKLIDEYPNDADLGKALRGLYNLYTVGESGENNNTKY